jgi:hypothetical protein
MTGILGATDPTSVRRLVAGLAFAASVAVLTPSLAGSSCCASCFGMWVVCCDGGCTPGGCASVSDYGCVMWCEGGSYNITC